MEGKSPRHSPVTPVEAVLWEPGGSPWACEGSSVSPANSSALLPLELPPSSQLFQQVPWRSSGAPPPWARPMFLLSCTESSVDWSSLLPSSPVYPWFFLVTLSFQCGVLWVSQVLGHPLRFLGSDHGCVPLENCCHSSLGAFTLPSQCATVQSHLRTQCTLETQERATVPLCKPWATWRGMSQASGSGGFSSLLYSSSCPNFQQR